MEGKLEEKKELLSIYKQHVISYLGGGIGWLLYALLYATGIKGTQLIGSIILIAAAVCSIVACILPKREYDDEMSIHHLQKAKSISWDITVLLVIGVIIYINVTNDTSKVSYIWGFVVGISQMLTGLLFHKYEKEGE